MVVHCNGHGYSHAAQHLWDDNSGMNAVDMYTRNVESSSTNALKSKHNNKLNEHLSQGTESAPRSLLLTTSSSFSSRELSDLSGSESQGHGSSFPNCKDSNGLSKCPDDICLNIYSSLLSSHTSWTQAYILSTPSPDMILQDLGISGKTSRSQEVPLMYQQHGENPNNIFQLDALSHGKCSSDRPSSRIPLFVLLPDIWKKRYELLRIFVDVEVDTVQIVLNSVRQSLQDCRAHHWKQDYDGLVQICYGKPRKLINCLGIKRYDVQPFECWIANPWSVPFNISREIALRLVNHLIQRGVIAGTSESVDIPDSVRLSTIAVSRIYEPGDTLDHYHARDYITFSPPFESLILDDLQLRDGRAREINVETECFESKMNGCMNRVCHGILNESKELEKSISDLPVMFQCFHNMVNFDNPSIDSDALISCPMMSHTRGNDDMERKQANVKTLLCKLWCRSLNNDSLQQIHSDSSCIGSTCAPGISLNFNSLRVPESDSASSVDDSLKSSLHRPLLLRECFEPKAKNCPLFHWG
jgi:hypothetical protein